MAAWTSDVTVQVRDGVWWHVRDRAFAGGFVYPWGSAVLCRRVVVDRVSGCGEGSRIGEALNPKALSNNFTINPSNPFIKVTGLRFFSRGGSCAWGRRIVFTTSSSQHEYHPDAISSHPAPPPQLNCNLTHCIILSTQGTAIRTAPQEKHFKYDVVLGPEASQEDVYRNVGMPMLRHTLQGVPLRWELILLRFPPQSLL